MVPVIVGVSGRFLGGIRAARTPRRLAASASYLVSCVLRGDKMMLSIFFLCFLPLFRMFISTKTCPTEYSIVLQDFERKHPVQQLQMLMTPKERILLFSYLNSSSNYFEFGAGGSTEMACSLDNIKKMVSTEGSAEFLKSLTNRSPCLSGTKKFVPNYVDIGPVGNWTVPLDKTTKPRWKDYALSIHNFKDLKPEVVLVDGRWRAACALSTLLLANENYTPTILIHDFFERLHHYKVVFKFTKMVKCADRLVALRPILPIPYETIQLEIQTAFGDFV